MAFFDKVKEGFDKSVATVSTGSKVVIEKSKINSTIKNQEDYIKQVEGLIGSKVYSLIASGVEQIPVSEVVDLYNDIVARRQQIELLKQRIVELDNEMNQVKGVGAPVVPVSFSSAAPVAAAPDAGVVCSCGEVNPQGSRFCSRCGSPLN